MREVDCQSKVIKAVRDAGGAAHKLSNRFLVGVPDLLIKLPRYSAIIMEVKLEKRIQFSDDRYPITPEVTQLQWEFLKKYHDAGMTTGVISFVQWRRTLRCLHVFLPNYRRGDSLRPTLYYLFDPETFPARLTEGIK